MNLIILYTSYKWKHDVYKRDIQKLSVFPDSSVGKESACNAGDLGSIPGCEDTLEKGKATHSSILAWGIQWTV